jgi:glycosyltransferase involved in cell wall biosynthesis
MEAIYCGVWPILPDRLSYKELFSDANYKDNFYSDDSLFYEKIKLSILNIKDIRRESMKNIPKKYDWKNIIKEYDEAFDDLAKNI